MTLDEQLSRLGITDTSGFFDDVCANLPPDVFERVTTRIYSVTPGTTEGGYSLFELSNYTIGIQNGVLTKSAEADVVVSETITPVTSSGTATEQVAIAHHGNAIVMMNGEEAVLFKVIEVDRDSDSNGMKQGMHDEFKALLFYLMAEDTAGIYAVLQRMSKLKDNLVAENRFMYPRVRRQAVEVTPWAL